MSDGWVCPKCGVEYELTKRVGEMYPGVYYLHTSSGNMCFKCFETYKGNPDTDKVCRYSPERAAIGRALMVGICKHVAHGLMGEANV